MWTGYEKGGRIGFLAGMSEGSRKLQLAQEHGLSEKNRDTIFLEIRTDSGLPKMYGVPNFGYSFLKAGFWRLRAATRFSHFSI